MGWLWLFLAARAGIIPASAAINAYHRRRK